MFIVFSGTPNRTLSKKPADSMTRTQLAHGSTILMSQSRVGDSTIQSRKNTQASGSDKAPPPLIKMAIQVGVEIGVYCWMWSIVNPAYVWIQYTLIIILLAS